MGYKYRESCGSCGSACTNGGGLCIDCTAGGQKCMNGNAYSVLGGVVAPKNSAYAISSMSNPLIERPTTKIDRSLPSLRDVGAIGNMENFNPYNSQYRNNVNFNQVNKSIPKSFGGNFYTNVQLENPTGSPVLQSHGINTGGYTGGGTPQARESGFCTGKCTRSRGFLRRKEKARCLSSGSGCQCSFNDGTTMSCGRSARR
tara:strand:- start:452 stop:1054 length:603 start_codon:yes stop_codon:yes gene_type:complete